VIYVNARLMFLTAGFMWSFMWTRTRLKRDSNSSSSKTKDPVSLKPVTFCL